VPAAVRPTASCGSRQSVPGQGWLQTGDFHAREPESAGLAIHPDTGLCGRTNTGLRAATN
jgi:hypothetical protein